MAFTSFSENSMAWQDDQPPEYHAPVKPPAQAIRVQGGSMEDKEIDCLDEKYIKSYNSIPSNVCQQKIPKTS